MSPTVVVGLDDSDESHAAADWAAREALRRGAVLDLVQVHETGPYPYSPLLDEEAEHDWAEQAARDTEEELRRAYPGLRTSTEFLAGRPSRVLSEVAAGSDLLVLGSRGLGAVLGFLVGSVALPAVAHSRCPVVLVRAGTPREAARHSSPPEDVVVGVSLDGRPRDELLAFAFQSAAHRSAALRVVHGWEPPPARGVRLPRPAQNPGVDAPHETAAESSEGTPGERGGERREALTHAVRPWREKYPDVPVDLQAVAGRPAHQLAHAASDASLLVVGRRVRRSRFGTHIGSVAHAVLLHADVPVAVVPHG